MRLFFLSVSSFSSAFDQIGWFCFLSCAVSCNKENNFWCGWVEVVKCHVRNSIKHKSHAKSQWLSKMLNVVEESDKLRKAFLPFHFFLGWREKTGGKSLFCHFHVVQKGKTGLIGGCRKLIKVHFSISVLRCDSLLHCLFSPPKHRRRWQHACRWAGEEPGAWHANSCHLDAACQTT